MEKKYGVVVLAGGKGTRFGCKKQFIHINGIPLWEKVKNTALEWVEPENIVVSGVDVKGGSTRTKSVFNGLRALRGMGLTDVVIVESARPLLLPSQLKDLMEIEGDSKTFVKPLVNTVIKKDKSYLDREDLVELLTPQGFNYPKLLEAYLSEKFDDVTDDTRIMFEYHGIKPVFLMGGENLMKVTYPKDIHVIQQLGNEIDGNF